MKISHHCIFRTPQSGLADLYYWLRDSKAGAAEVDFLIAQGGEIFPLEVKSGPAGKMRSLWQYVADKKANRVIRVDLSQRKTLISSVNHKVTDGQGMREIKCELLGIPLYAIERLAEFLDD